MTNFGKREEKKRTHEEDVPLHAKDWCGIARFTMLRREKVSSGPVYLPTI